MKYCHGCLKRIWFWESRAEGQHIKCLPIERSCKYYHIQRDSHTSILLALFVCILILVSFDSIISYYIAVIVGIFIFLFSNIIAGIIRDKEEEKTNGRF